MPLCSRRSVFLTNAYRAYGGKGESMCENRHVQPNTWRFVNTQLGTDRSENIVIGSDKLNFSEVLRIARNLRLHAASVSS